MELTEFLLARIAEDERAVHLSAPGERWRAARMLWEEGNRTGNWHHLTAEQSEAWAVVGDRILSELVGGSRWDPNRVLAELEAKRRIVLHHQIWCEPETIGPGAGLVREDAYAVGVRYSSAIVLTQLALLYADHPDYQKEWTP